MMILVEVFLSLGVAILLIWLIATRRNKGIFQQEEIHKFYPWADHSYHFRVVDKERRKFYLQANGEGEVRIINDSTGEIVKKWNGTNVKCSFYLPRGKYELQTDTEKFGYLKTIYLKRQNGLW